MQITRTVDETRLAVRQLAPVAFVPTMGALHEGHLSLVRKAREFCRHVAVSIFVNPTQFGPGEDFNRYPRPFEQDLSLCREAGVDLVFAPSAEDMYPEDELPVDLRVPALDGILEGTLRPGHFAGVCRVVAKLFGIVQPEVACFGRKDYQQLQVIEAMTRALALPVRIVGCPTVRDADGLALSSRNRYLDTAQRPKALGLSRALKKAAGMIAGGTRDPALVENAMNGEMKACGVIPDYAVVRDARTLQPVPQINPAPQPVVLLVAGRVGTVRLIDNQLLPGSD